MSAHRLTNDELEREARRRGFELTRPKVELTRRERAAIECLIAAAEDCQKGKEYAAWALCDAAYSAATISSWVGAFALECRHGVVEWSRGCHND